MTLTKDDERYLDDVIRNLGLDHFNPTYFPDEYDDMWTYLKSFIDSDDFDIHAGASKAVIDIHDLPYVIKIPFFTERRYDSHYDTYDCFSFVVDEWNGAYYPLENRRGKNYCRAEAELSYLAKLYGVGEFFAETEFYCTYNSHRGDQWPIYIQEKVDTLYYSYEPSNEQSSNRDSRKIDKIKEDTEKRMKKVTGKKERRNIFPPTYFMSDCITRYGEEKLKRMLEFCWIYNINDLHSSNVGYNGDDPVIFDYSGYHNY